MIECSVVDIKQKLACMFPDLSYKIQFFCQKLTRDLKVLTILRSM